MSWFQHISDTEMILAVGVMFYFSECVYWISHRSVCFSSLGRSFDPHRTVSFMASDRHGFVLTAPTPFATSFVCEGWPVFVSPEGVYTPSGQAVPDETAADRDGNYVFFHEKCSVKVLGCEVWVNGKLLTSLASSTHAEFFKRCLDEFSATCRHDREEAIQKKLQAMTDVDSIMQRISSLRRETSSVKVASTILFLYTFGLGPALYYLAITVPTYGLLVYLTGFAACWLYAILSFCSAHHRLYPDGGAERRKCWALMVLSPVAAMRCPNALSRNLLASYHPVAVAVAVCAQRTLLKFAKPFLLDLQYALPTASHTENPACYRTEQWFRSCLENQLREVLLSSGIDNTDLLKPPAPDPDARSYCPRCHSQFVLAAGVCEDCRGVRLMSFEGFCDEDSLLRPISTEVDEERQTGKRYLNTETD
jgi:hypothetical protein